MKTIPIEWVEVENGNFNGELRYSNQELDLSFQLYQISAIRWGFKRILPVARHIDFTGSLTECKDNAQKLYNETRRQHVKHAVKAQQLNLF